MDEVGSNQEQCGKEGFGHGLQLCSSIYRTSYARVPGALPYDIPSMVVITTLDRSRRNLAIAIALGLLHRFRRMFITTRAKELCITLPYLSMLTS